MNKLLFLFLCMFKPRDGARMGVRRSVWARRRVTVEGCNKVTV